MHCQNALAPAALLRPDHCISCEPVVRMNNVERADVILRLENMVHERAAHIIDLVDKVGMKVERATVIVDAVYTRIL